MHRQGWLFGADRRAEPLQQKRAQPFNRLRQMAIMAGARDVENVVVDFGLIFGRGFITAAAIIQFQDQAIVAIPLPLHRRFGGDIGQHGLPSGRQGAAPERFQCLFQGINQHQPPFVRRRRCAMQSAAQEIGRGQR